MPSQPLKKKITRLFHYFLSSAFEILMVIVMLNMLSLILLRSHTSDIEWIFGRSQVYLPYMSDVATPPPFNIFAICLNVYRDFMKRRNCPEYWQEEEKVIRQLIHSYYDGYYVCHSRSDCSWNLSGL